MPINFDLSQYLNPVFIETGTYDGDGVTAALNVGFNTILLNWIPLDIMFAKKNL